RLVAIEDSDGHAALLANRTKQLGVGRTWAADELEPLLSGREGVERARLDMNHRAFDDVPRTAGGRILHGASTLDDVIDRLHGMRELRRRASRFQHDAAHGPHLGTDARPDDGQRLAVPSHDWQPRTAIIAVEHGYRRWLCHGPTLCTNERAGG